MAVLKVIQRCLPHSSPEEWFALPVLDISLNQITSSSPVLQGWERIELQARSPQNKEHAYCVLRRQNLLGEDGHLSKLLKRSQVIYNFTSVLLCNEGCQGQNRQAHKNLWRAVTGRGIQQSCQQLILHSPCHLAIYNYLLYLKPCCDSAILCTCPVNWVVK